MSSLNNILMFAETPALYKYAKAIPSKLSGVRLDPVTFREIPFRLESGPDGFEYDNDVIEFYNERDHKFFLQVNRNFIKNGFLKIHTGDATPADLANVISDEEVELIASTRTNTSLRKQLSKITSKVALLRILDMATEIGRPKSVIDIIEQRIQEI